VVGKSLRQRSLAGGLSSKRLLHMEGKTAVLFPCLDGDEEQWSVVAMATKDSGGDRAEQRREEVRWKRNGSRTPPLSCPRLDKASTPTWVGDDRQ
jgi:hypothetical protein